MQSERAAEQDAPRPHRARHWMGSGLRRAVGGRVRGVFIGGGSKVSQRERGQGTSFSVVNCERSETSAPACSATSSSALARTSHSTCMHIGK